MADSSMARALSRSKTELTSTNTGDSCCTECESVTCRSLFWTGFRFEPWTSSIRCDWWLRNSMLQGFCWVGNMLYTLRPVYLWYIFNLNMCGCFGNMCTCIYCVLYCLYCVFVFFVYVYLFLFVTSVRTTATEWKLNCSK